MREVDKAFLTIFKDLKIVRDKANPGDDSKPNYNCYIGKNVIGNAEVVRLVKRYQDAIIEQLLQNGDN